MLINVPVWSTLVASVTPFSVGAFDLLFYIALIGLGVWFAGLIIGYVLGAIRGAGKRVFGRKGGGRRRRR